MVPTSETVDIPRRSPAAIEPPSGTIAVKGKSVFDFAFRDQKFLYGTQGKGDDMIVLNPDPVLEAEGEDLGLGIYDADADGDPNLSGLYETRTQSVIGLGWEIQPANDSDQAKAEAEFVTRAFWGVKDFEDARRRAFQGSRRKGYSITEPIWGGVDGYSTIVELRDHDPRQFVFDAAWRPRVIVNPADLSLSKPVDPRKAVVMRHRAKHWNPYGVGIGQVLHYNATYKKHVLNFWAVYCEKHATPTLEAIYKGNAKANADAILEMAEGALESQAVAHDDAVELKPIESARAGNVEAYKQLLEVLNDEQAIAVLGQVLSSTAKPTGLNSGVANEQGAVRQDYLQYDAFTMADFLNELSRMLVDANFGPRPANEYPKAVVHAEPAVDTAKIAETLQLAQELGMEIPMEFAYAALGVPMPKPGEAILVKPTPIPAFGGAGGGNPDDVTGATDTLDSGTNAASMGDSAAA